MKLKHVVPNKQYEKQAIEYINEFYKYNSSINGVGGLDRYLDDYDGWLLKLDLDRTRKPNEERVPALTFFLVREKDDRIVGMINIRLSLNEQLKKFGGNIGYSIRPSERRKGYNKINLYLGLVCCMEHNIKEVLLDCDKNNVGSRKTIEDLGGVLVKEYYNDINTNSIVRDYKIDVLSSVSKNKYLIEDK